MVNQGLDVPPPLRRGGSHTISTGPKTPSKITLSKITPSKITPSKRATARAATAKSGRAKKAVSETSDEDGYSSDSEADYGKPSVKRAKTTPKNKGRMKVEDSGDEVNTPTKRGDLRQGSRGKSKMLGEGSDDETDSEDDVRQDGEEIVAVGAPFLSLVDDSPGKGQTGRKTVNKAKSLIVKLPFTGQIKDTIKGEEASTTKDNGSEATEDDPNGAGSDHDKVQMGGFSDQTNMAFGLQAAPRNAASYGDYHVGLGMFSPNAHQRSQSDNTHGGAIFFSPGPHSGHSQFCSMMHDQDMQYSTGFENFGGMDYGHGGLPNTPNHWQNSGFDIYNNNHLSAHFDNADAHSVLSPHLQASFHGHSASSPHIPTSFHGHSRATRPHIMTSVPGIVAPHSTPAGGDYSSAGASTVNITPSSDEAGYAHASWPMHDGMPGGSFGTNDDIDEVFAAVINRDEYGSGYNA